MKKIITLLIISPSLTYARGGQGDGALIIGLIGVAIAFVLSKIVGEKLFPDGDSTLQIFAGFFSILFCVVLLLKIVN